MFHLRAREKLGGESDIMSFPTAALDRLPGQQEKQGRQAEAKDHGPDVDATLDEVTHVLVQGQIGYQLADPLALGREDAVQKDAAKEDSAHRDTHDNGN